MKINLDTLFELTADFGIPKDELRNRWARWFAGQDRANEFDSLLLGMTIEVKEDAGELREIASRLIRQHSVLSRESKSYIEATMNPDNVGMTTEAICNLLEIDPSKVYEECLSVPFVEYCKALRAETLEHEAWRCKLTLLRAFSKMLREQPQLALAQLANLAKTEALPFFIGKQNALAGECADGNAEIEAIEVDYKVIKENNPTEAPSDAAVQTDTH